MKSHLQELTTSKGRRTPVQAAFPCLWHRQCQRSVEDLLTALWPLVLHPGVVEVGMVLVSTWG